MVGPPVRALLLPVRNVTGSGPPSVVPPTMSNAARTHDTRREGAMRIQHRHVERRGPRWVEEVDGHDVIRYESVRMVHAIR